VPTKELIDHVREKIENEIDDARELVADVARTEPLPKDNRPLAEYPPKQFVR